MKGHVTEKQIRDGAFPGAARRGTQQWTLLRSSPWPWRPASRYREAAPQRRRTACGAARARSEMEGRVYENTLRPVVAPGPLLADWPRFVSPVVAATRFEGPPLVEDPGADLAVRAGGL